MIVQTGRNQIIGNADRVHVAGEVQVDVLHRNYLGVTASCRSALDAEDRPRMMVLSKQRIVFAHFVQGIRKTDDLLLSCPLLPASVKSRSPTRVCRPAYLPCPSIICNQFLLCTCRTVPDTVHRSLTCAASSLMFVITDSFAQSECRS